ncbi:penicillin acylase family protein [Candidatus Palauibacter sp.]|uniref:penicillin acylase family protein n=1 Tax=Candidatus Palauibacter sp. TaxID=3101350 RepID=UPI003C6EEBFC
MNSTRTLAVGAVLLAVGPAGPPAAAAQDQVTIHRDPWGMPHILAEAEEAGFYGLGWAQAEDQLEFILTMFLSARGEAAAAYGAETAPRVGNPLAADVLGAHVG